MKYTFLLFALLFACTLSAQTEEGLVAYYSFNNCDAADDTGNGSNGAIVGNPGCVCGVDGEALKLDGFDDHILLLGIIGNYFEKDDFTLSFFFNPIGILGTQTILSKKEACDDINAFAVRYTRGSNRLTVELSENSSKRSILTTSLDLGRCWQHVTIVRSGPTTRLYINGTLRETNTVISRIDLTNNAVMGISEGPCVNTSDNPYSGLIDDLRVYRRALDEDEVLGLYTPFEPDNIITRDTTIFLGNSIQIQSSESCADTYEWTPVTGISDATITEPIITPEETTTYTLAFLDNDVGCSATDSIRIFVLDPDDLDCSKLFLPSAFTPNADGRNDKYGISNPYAVDELISFEIFDRWGSRVFITTDPMERWDGTYKGQALNPGVLLYKVRFRCNNEELVDVGSLSLIK